MFFYIYIFPFRVFLIPTPDNGFTKTPRMANTIEELLPDGLLPGVENVDQAIDIYTKLGRAYNHGSRYCALRLVNPYMEHVSATSSAAQPASGTRGQSKRERRTGIRHSVTRKALPRSRSRSGADASPSMGRRMDDRSPRVPSPETDSSLMQHARANGSTRSRGAPAHYSRSRSPAASVGLSPSARRRSDSAHFGGEVEVHSDSEVMHRARAKGTVRSRTPSTHRSHSRSLARSRSDNDRLGGGAATPISGSVCVDDDSRIPGQLAPAVAELDIGRDNVSAPASLDDGLGTLIHGAAPVDDDPSIEAQIAPAVELEHGRDTMPIPSQSDPISSETFLREAMSAAMAAASLEGEKMVQDIKADEDPGAKIRAGIATSKRDALRKHNAQEPDLLTDNVTAEAVYAELTRATYDENALAAAFDLDSWHKQNLKGDDPLRSLKTHLKAHFKDFFASFEDGPFSAEQTRSHQDSLGINITADRWTGCACERIAKCNGMPANGQVVHTALQGRIKSWFCGPENDLHVEVIEDSESPWPLAGHGAGVWLVGDSGLGKDNLINVVTFWMSVLADAFPGRACMTELDIGRLSYTGLLEALEAGASPLKKVHWLTWLNSEITQCISQEAGGIRERDICQLGENTAMGKRVKGQHVRRKAAFWTLMGTQEDTFKETMGSMTFGRLRMFAALIDETDVFDVIVFKNTLHMILLSGQY